MPPRVLYLVADLDSGIGVSLLNSARHLTGRESLVCELSPRGPGSTVVAQGVDLELVQLGRPGVDPRALAGVLRTARRFRPDVVQGFELETNFYACLVGRLTGARVVTTFHGMVGAFRRSRRPFLLLALRSADRIVCVSSAIAERCRACAPGCASRILVIPNGIDAEPYDGRARAFAAGSRLTLTCVANFHSMLKGHGELLQALALLDPAEAELWLVGDGPFMSEARALADSLGVEGRVKFWGRRDDVARILSDSDLFVLPSLSEGFPHALLEAMASGLPVVASRVGGIPDMIETGESGLLVEPGDPAAIRDAVRELASNPDLRRRMSAAGRRRVHDHFQAEPAARRFGEVYDALAS